VTLDQELTFALHINRLCHDCYYQLRQLRIISCSLTSNATATLVHAFVTARFDYCSTLYVGIPALSLGCLELVIRTSARLIGGIPRTGHVSIYMPDVIHWLSFQHCIVLRISALVWRCLRSLAPAYLRDLCYLALGTRGSSCLRSMERGVFFVPESMGGSQCAGQQNDRDDAFRSEGRGFESRSSRHVWTLDKSFTYS